MATRKTYTILGPAEPMQYINKTVVWADRVTNLKHPTSRRETFDCTDSIFVTEFSDGTALACVTEIRGPYSEVTPDIELRTYWYAVVAEK